MFIINSSSSYYKTKYLELIHQKFQYNFILIHFIKSILQDGVSPTLRSKTGEEIGPLWRKNGLSNADIRKLHKLYSCKGISCLLFLMLTIIFQRKTFFLLIQTILVIRGWFPQLTESFYILWVSLNIFKTFNDLTFNNGNF